VVTIVSAKRDFVSPSAREREKSKRNIVFHSSLATCCHLFRFWCCLRSLVLTPRVICLISFSLTEHLRILWAVHIPAHAAVKLQQSRRETRALSFPFIEIRHGYSLV
jgi:hypothetical protein